MRDISQLNSNQQPRNEADNMPGSWEQQPQHPEPSQQPSNEPLRASKHLQSHNQKQTATKAVQQAQSVPLSATRKQASRLGMTACSVVSFNMFFALIRSFLALTRLWTSKLGDSGANGNTFILVSTTFAGLCAQYCIQVALWDRSLVRPISPVPGLTLERVPYVLLLSAGMTIYGLCYEWFNQPGCEQCWSCEWAHLADGGERY